MAKARERDQLQVLPPEDELEEEPVERLPAVPAKPAAEEPLGETPDSVELYLNEIARYKLLRPDEEVTLAKEIENGRILNEIGYALTEELRVHPSPSTEQITVRFLRDVQDGLALVRRSRVLKGM